MRGLTGAQLSRVRNQRSWIKYRENRVHEFGIGGYIPGAHGFDSHIVWHYEGKVLKYVARVRSGFVTASRRHVFEKIHHPASQTMPFTNLPDTRKSRRGDELGAKSRRKPERRGFCGRQRCAFLSVLGESSETRP